MYRKNVSGFLLNNEAECQRMLSTERIGEKKKKHVADGTRRKKIVRASNQNTVSRCGYPTIII